MAWLSASTWSRSSREILGMWLNLLGERPDRRSFVVFHVEDGVELGDLQQVVHFLRQVKQLQFAALIADGGERAHQLADARAVDVRDFAQVEQDLLIALRDQIADRIAQHHAAFAERDPPAQVYD